MKEDLSTITLEKKFGGLWIVDTFYNPLHKSNSSYYKYEIDADASIVTFDGASFILQEENGNSGKTVITKNEQDVYSFIKRNTKLKLYK